MKKVKQLFTIKKAIFINVKEGSQFQKLRSEESYDFELNI